MSLRSLALALALALALHTHGSAQPLEVQVDAGWDGAFVEDAWAPLRATLTLPAGARPVRGRVVCEPLPFERVPGVAVPFELAPAPDHLATSVVTLAVPARGEVSFVVRVEDERGSELALGRPRDLPRRLDPKDRLVLLAGRRSGLSALESSFSPLHGVANRPGLVRVARVGPVELPDRSFILGGVAAVFLEDGPGMLELARDEGRVAALRGFVESGAVLVVVGGRGVAFWAGSALDALLPVDAGGETEPLGPHLTLLGAPVSQVPVARCKLREGAREILQDPGGQVLAAERRVGRGRAVFLAFDPDNPELRGASELPAFLARLVFDARPAPPAASLPALAELTGRTVLERPALGPAGLLGLVLVVAASLVIFGPVAARRRSAPLRVLVAPLAAAALAALVVLLAALSRPPLESDAFVYAFAESGEDVAYAVEDAVLFSGGATRVDIELSENASLASLEAPRLDLLDFRERRPDLFLEPGGAALVPGVALAPRSFAWFRACACVRLGSPPRVRWTGSALVLEGPLPEGIALHEDAVQHAIVWAATPPLAAGARTEVRLDRPLADPRSEDSPWEQGEREAERAHLARALGAVADELQLAGHPSRPLRTTRTWLAVPWELGPLLAVRSTGGKVPRTHALSALLVAAEEGP
jgi:hypothetical protein